MQSSFRRICTQSSYHSSTYIYQPISTNRLIFGKGGFFHLVLSEYANQSPNFTNLKFFWRHTFLLYLLAILENKTGLVLCSTASWGYESFTCFVCNNDERSDIASSKQSQSAVWHTNLVSCRRANTLPVLSVRSVVRKKSMNNGLTWDQNY